GNMGQQLLSVFFVLQLETDRLLQPFPHLLEGRPQLPDLIPPMQSHLLIQIPFLDPFRRAFQQGQRFDNAAGNQESQDPVGGSDDQQQGEQKQREKPFSVFNKPAMSEKTYTAPWVPSLKETSRFSTANRSSIGCSHGPRSGSRDRSRRRAPRCGMSTSGDW